MEDGCQQEKARLPACELGRKQCYFLSEGLLLRFLACSSFVICRFFDNHAHAFYL